MIRTPGTFARNVSRIPACSAGGTQIRAGGCEQARQLAGARGKVDDARTRRDAQMLDEPRDGVGRIRRPRRLVVDGIGESGGRYLMNHA
jgi:hypothetical protein